MVQRKQPRAVVLDKMNKITGKPKITFKLNPHNNSMIWDAIQFHRDRTAVVARVLRGKITGFKKAHPLSRYASNTPARVHIEQQRMTEKAVRNDLNQGAAVDPNARQSYYIKGDDPKKKYSRKIDQGL